MTKKRYCLPQAACFLILGFLSASPMAAGARSTLAIAQSQGPNLGTYPIGQVETSLTATGGDGVNYAWSVIAGTLPPGISLRPDKPSYFPSSASAGLIGIATTPGTYSFTLRVTSNGETADRACTMKISALTVKDGFSLPNAYVGTAYSYTLTAFGNAGALTWSATSGVPAGMTLSATGVLSGTPTSAGNIGMNFTVTDGTDTVSRSITINVLAINVVPASPVAPNVLPNATQNVAYNASVTASGGTGPYTYTASGLPFGLSLNASTGAITGTSGPGRYNPSVTATDSLNVSSSKTLALSVVPTVAALPTVQPSGSSFDDCTLGLFCTRTAVVQSSGPAPFTWSVSGLPNGMSFRTGSGVTSSFITTGDVELWGVPTASGLFNVQVTVADGTGATASNTFPLRVSALLQTNGLNSGPNGVINTPFSRTLRVIGGTLPYTVALTSGSLSAGVTLNSSTLVASGTPTESGFFSSQLTYTDAAGSTLRAPNSYSVTGAGSGGVTINNSADLGTTTLGSAYSRPLSGSGGTLTWSLVSGTLPNGVTLSSGGLLSGTTTVAGVFTFMVKAADSVTPSNFAVRQFTLNVTPLVFTMGSTLIYGNVGTAYSQTLTATGGTLPLTWTLATFNYLPPGLTLAANGTLSGTPTAKGRFIFTVVVTDAASNTAKIILSVSIYGAGEAPPVGQTQSANFGTRSIGQVELPLSATGGNGTYAWSLQAGALPPGISVRPDKPTTFSPSASAGLIGVATTPGNYSFTLRVTSSGQTFDQASTLKITALAVQDPTSVPDAYVGAAYSYTFTALGNAAPVTWSATNGLPAGMTLSATGVLSGTPTSAGFASVNFTVTDGTDTISRSVSLTVSALNVAPASPLAPGVLPNATQTVAYSQQLTASGGTGPYTYSGFGLPSGLSMSSGGLITGTVSSGSFNLGKFSLSITARDSLNVSYQKTLSLTVVSASPALPMVLPSSSSFDDCTFGVPCTRTVLVQSGGAAPFAWTASGLPAGMSFRTGSGVTGSFTTPGDLELWGAPTASGLFNVQVTVTDGAGATASNTFPLRVSTLLQTNGLSGTNGVINTPFSRTLRVIGGTLPYTVAQTGGAMAAGVTLNSSTLVASGTPTESGSFSNQLTYTDAAGSPATLRATSSYTINGAGSGAISINSSANLGSTTLGSPYSNSLFASGAGSITWSVTGGTLPTGVTLSSGGLLSGTPSAAGVFTFTLKAADSVTPANFAARQFTLNVTTINITTSSPLVSGNVGTAYSQSLTATGGSGALTWTLSPFNYLPPGLTLASNGTLSGTPTAKGQFSFVVGVADAAMQTRTTTLNLSILGAGEAPPVSQTQTPNFGTRSLGQVELALSATGGNGTYVWSLQAGTLPPGLAIRTDFPSCCFPGTASAGLIGVATTPGNYSFTLRATSGSQTSDLASTLKITALTGKDLSSLPDAFVGTPYSYTLTALGNAGTVTFSTTSTLPAGLTLSSAGVLSGTPTASGNGNFFYTMSDGTDSVGRSVNLKVSAIDVAPASPLAPGVLPNATQTVPYSASVSASGGTAPYTYSTFSPLPSGLTLDASTGAISGTVSAGTFNLGKFSISVSARDSLNVSYEKTLSLTVVGSTPVLPMVLPSGSLFDDCTLGIPCSRSVVVQSGGVAPFGWAVSGLPAGMSFRTGSGVTSSSTTPGDAELWGTPTASGVFNVQVTVTDATGASATNTFPLRVSTLLQTNGLNTFSNGLINTPFSRTLRVIGGTLPYTAAVTSGALPAGVTLNSSTLLVSGTPTESGYFTTQLTYTDAAGSPQTLRVTSSYTINGAGSGAISINSPANLGSILLGAPYSNSLFSSGAGSITWSLVGGTLPDGLTLSSAGLLSGTTTVAGVFTFTLQAADTGTPANFAARQFTLNVTPLLVTTMSPLPDGSVGTAYNQTLTATGGTGGLTWTLLPFNYLPPGITLSSDGTLSGTPTAKGQFVFTVMVADTASHSWTSSLTLSIGASPVITLSPADAATSAGANASFTVAATGFPAPTYQWQVSTDGGSTFANLTNSAFYSGVTTTTLSITGATSGMNGDRYRAVATNGFGSANSTAAILTVTFGPAITSNPSNATVTAGTNANFTVAASGNPAPTYQWQVSTDGGSTFANLSDGAPYSNVTTATLTVAAAAGLNGYLYRAVATNGLGSATSTPAILTVNIAPAITTQPPDATAASGTNATFTVAASGNPAPTYQWQVSTDGGSTFANLSDGAPYSNVTTATLTVAAAAGLNGYRYRAVATNSVGSATSTAAILTVNFAPAITTQPADATVAVGTNATFTVAASGNPAPTYQWQVSTNGGVAFTNIAEPFANLSDGGPYSNVTTATLTITGVTSGMNGYRYRAVATNGSGSATSTAATLTVIVAPAITTQPADATVASGANANFTVAASGNPAPAYQWQLSTDGGSTFANLSDGAPYSNVTTATLTITGVTSAMNGYRYRAVATNGSGSATSTAAILTVNFAPAITTQPSDATVTAGTNATFTVAASGNPAPTYQWQVSTDGGSTFANLSNGAPYSNVTTATLTVTGVTSGMNGSRYRAVATNGSGSATSTAAILTVNVAPAITTQPSDATATSGTNATFAVAASGNPAPTFQWQVSTDGGSTFANLSNGAPYSNVTTATLTVTAAAGLNGYRYRAVATNGSGSATSTPAILTVNVAPAITTQPSNATAASGTNGTFIVAASGNPAPTYQWQVSTNGGGVFTNLTESAPHSGTASATLTVAASAGLNGNQYRAVATNSVGSATSNAATLTVTGAPTVTAVSPASGSIAGGVGLTITGTSFVAGVTSVSIGGTAATSVNVLSSTSLTAVTPAHAAGLVSVAVTTPSGTGTLPNAFTYVTALFTDDPLQPGVTPIKVIHITELRGLIDTLRSRFGLSAVSWTDPTIVAGTTPIKAVHLTEIRTALQAVYVAAGRTPPTYTNATLTAGSTSITVLDIMEIRAAIAAIF